MSGGVMWLDEGRGDAAVEFSDEPESDTPSYALADQAQQPKLLPSRGPLGPGNLHLLRTQRAKVTACVSPNYMDDVLKGLASVMDSALFRYNTKTETLMVAYSSLQARPRKSMLTRVESFLTIDGSALVYMFELQAGDVVCGYVRRLSSSGMSVLIMGGVSVEVPAQLLQEDMQYDHTNRCWVPGGEHSKGGDYTRAIHLGDVVTCIVLHQPVPDPDQEEIMFTTTGSMQGDNTGLHDWQPPQQQQLRRRVATAAAAAAGGGGSSDAADADAAEQGGGGGGATPPSDRELQEQQELVRMLALGVEARAALPSWQRKALRRVEKQMERERRRAERDERRIVQAAQEQAERRAKREAKEAKRAARDVAKDGGKAGGKKSHKRKRQEQEQGGTPNGVAAAPAPAAASAAPPAVNGLQAGERSKKHKKHNQQQQQQ